MKKQAQEFDFETGEVLLVDKPKDWTSFDVVKKVRGLVRAKTGHAGTLDPLATGLLILCTGKMTKQIDTIQGQQKVYTGTIYLGEKRPSHDLETEPTETLDINHLTEEMIRSEGEKFKGTIDQIPPAYSAMKVGGRRAYQLAREGRDVPLVARPVEIHDFTIESIEGPEVHFSLTCSKGTYVRSLARDLGDQLGVGAYLACLRREMIGDHHVNDAYTIDDLVSLFRSGPEHAGPKE